MDVLDKGKPALKPGRNLLTSLLVLMSRSMTPPSPLALAEVRETCLGAMGEISTFQPGGSSEHPSQSGLELRSFDPSFPSPAVEYRDRASYMRTGDRQPQRGRVKVEMIDSSGRSTEVARMSGRVLSSLWLGCVMSSQPLDVGDRLIWRFRFKSMPNMQIPDSGRYGRFVYLAGEVWSSPSTWSTARASPHRTKNGDTLSSRPPLRFCQADNGSQCKEKAMSTESGPEYFYLRPEVEKAYGYTHAIRIGRSRCIKG